MTERELAIVDQVLEHENIVKIIERGDVATRSRGCLEIYIVMEYCEGGDLNNYIIKNEPDLKERFNLMTDMAKGVLYLHGQNIVHRDLKPENVLRGNTGQRYVCKITDFGLSRIMEDKQEMFSTQCGTLAYLAPEIVDGRPYSKSVDVFALGLLFFAVYRLTFIPDISGEKSLVPVKITPNKRYDFLNSVIRNDQPSESTFITTYFKRSEAMGRLVYSMVHVKPDRRLVMDKVLIGVVEVGAKHEMEDMVKKLQEKIKIQENIIKEQEEKLNNLPLSPTKALKTQPEEKGASQTKKNLLSPHDIKVKEHAFSKTQDNINSENQLVTVYEQHTIHPKQLEPEQRAVPSCPPLYNVSSETGTFVAQPVSVPDTTSASPGTVSAPPEISVASYPMSAPPSVPTYPLSAPYHMPGPYPVPGPYPAPSPAPFPSPYPMSAPYPTPYPLPQPNSTVPGANPIPGLYPVSPVPPNGPNLYPVLPKPSTN